jgi:hypothetical protein
MAREDSASPRGLGAGDPELLHAALQGRRLDREQLGGAAGAVDAPAGATQGALDVLGLGFFQREEVACLLGQVVGDMS